MLDREQFDNAIDILGSYYNTKTPDLNPKTLDIWFSLVKNLNNYKFEASVRKIMENETWFPNPLPAHINKYYKEIPDCGQYLYDKEGNLIAALYNGEPEEIYEPEIYNRQRQSLICREY